MADDIKLNVGATLDMKGLEAQLKELKKQLKDETKKVVFEGDSGSLAKIEKQITRVNKLISDGYAKQNKLAEQSLTHQEKLQLKRLENKKLILQKELVAEQTNQKAIQNAHIKSMESMVSRHKIAFEKLKAQNKLNVNEQIYGFRAVEQASKISQQNMLNDAKVAKAKIAKVNSDYAKTFMGSLTEGTTFGHKLATTAQYAIAGSSLYALAGAFTSLKDAVVESDKYLQMFKGVLELNDVKAKELQQSIFNVGKEFGGTTQGISEAALQLGRAGLEGEKLATGLKVASQAALISGDSIENVTEMLSSWSIAYQIDDMKRLGDVMVKVANESLLSIDGLKTATSYITAAGASAGVTAENLISLAGAWKQTGKADSIVGTEIRRLFSQIEGGSEEARKAYWAMGIDIYKVNKALKSGDKATQESAMKSFMAQMGTYEKLPKAQKEAVDKILGTMQVLDKQTIQSGFIAGREYADMAKAADNASGSLDEASKKISLSYEKMWERIKAAGVESAVKLEEGFKKSFSGSSTTAEQFDTKMIELSKTFNAVAESAGLLAGEIATPLVTAIGGAVTALGSLVGIASSFASYAKDATTAVAGMTGGFSTLAIEIGVAAVAFKKFPMITIIAEALRLIDMYREILDLKNQINRDGLQSSASTASAKDISMVAGYKSKSDKLKEAVRIETELVSRLNKLTSITDEQRARTDSATKNKLDNSIIILSKRLESIRKLKSDLQVVEKKDKPTKVVDISAVGAMPTTEKDKESDDRDAERAARERLRLLVKEREQKESILFETMVDETQRHKAHLETLHDITLIANRKEFASFKNLQDDIIAYEMKESDYKGDTAKKIAERKIESDATIAIKMKEAELSAQITEEGKINKKLELELEKNLQQYNKDKLIVGNQLNAQNQKLASDAIARAEQEKSFAELAIKDAETLRDIRIDIAEQQANIADGMTVWADSIGKINSEYGNVANSISGIYAFQKKAAVAQEQLEIKYAKKAEGRDKKDLKSAQFFADLEEEKSKEQAIIDYNNYQAQLDMYGNLAGAMSSMFKQGSKEAAAFQIIQTALAGISGVTAILEQGKGDPYTSWGRMAAMAAIVIPMVTSIGGSIKTMFGGEKVSTSSDAFSSMAANDGKGSVLGDASKASESIANSLELMGDIAKPEFALISQMNKSLISIDQKTGGVSSLLLRQGGFAFGEGYEGFDTGYSNNISTTSGVGGLASKALGVGAMGMAGSAALGLGSWAALGTLGPVGIAVAIADKLLLGGAISGVINSAVGSIVGGIFGKTSVSQTMTDSGIYFADALLTSAKEQFEGSAYQTISTKVSKKSWFSKSSSTSIATYFDGLNSEVERQFSLVLGGLYDTTMLAGNALDTSALSIETSLANFAVSIGKISLKGKTGDEIQETLSGVFGKISDDIAKQAFPLLTSFQRVGEGLFETMARVSVGMEEAEYYINKLGYAFDDISYLEILNKQGDVGFEALTQSIMAFEEASYGLNNGVSQIIETLTGSASEIYDTYIALQGMRLQISATGVDAKYLTAEMLKGGDGLDSLANALTSFIDNFLSSGEQFSYQVDTVKAGFDKLGIAMPNSKQGFEDLIGMIDVSTASGQNLYGALILLSDGFNEVAEQAQSMLQAYSDIFNRIDTLLGVNVVDTLSSLGSLIATATIDNAQVIIDRLVEARDSEITSLTTQLDTLKTSIEAFTNTAKAVRNKAFTSDTYAESAYLAIFNKITDAQANNLDYSGMTSELNTAALAYTDALKAQSTSESDFQFKSAILASQIEALGGGTSEATMTDLQSSIDAINNTFKGMLGDLNINLESQLVTFISENEKYFGANSLMIGRLTSVETWMASLYEVQEQARAADTAHLSSSSFSAGHIFGTQEKIDFAQKTGLTIGSESFNKAIVDIQGFATRSDDANYLAGLNDTTKGALSALGSTAPSDAISASSQLKAQADEQRRKANIKLGYVEWLQANTVTWMNNPANPAYGYGKDAEANVATLSKLLGGTPSIGDLFGTPIYRTGFTDNQLTDMQKYYANLAVAKVNGFSSGGYTGDMGVNSIAGIVHGQEYVVNAQTTKDLGLNNSSGVFEELLSEIKQLKQLNIKLTSVSMSQLDTQRAMLSESIA
jgi:molybdenum-dependent DNA-binding transcriptional regulator ModE